MATEAKSERWSIRVSPTEDTIVRRALAQQGVSLNEYVVNHAVSAAIDDLADRRLFLLSGDEWVALQEILDRPPTAKPRLEALLQQPSVLEAE